MLFAERSLMCSTFDSNGTAYILRGVEESSTKVADSMAQLCGSPPAAADTAARRRLCS